MTREAVTTHAKTHAITNAIEVDGIRVATDGQTAFCNQVELAPNTPRCRFYKPDSMCNAIRSDGRRAGLYFPEDPEFTVKCGGPVGRGLDPEALAIISENMLKVYIRSNFNAAPTRRGV